MAVVFISPKQRQKAFFIGITVVFLLILAAISFGVFLSQPKEVISVLVFNEPKVNIDMGVFELDQFKNLQPFSKMEKQYSYKANTKNGKPKTGFVSAASEEDAVIALKSNGLIVVEIKEVEIGRENPFTPYYSTTTTAANKTTK